MKIQMKIVPGTFKPGMLKAPEPTYDLNVVSQFTETEKAAILKLDIAGYSIVDDYLPVDPKQCEHNFKFLGKHEQPFSVSALFNSNPLVIQFRGLLVAQNTMGEIKNNLEKLKDVLERADWPNEMSFEL